MNDKRQETHLIYAHLCVQRTSTNIAFQANIIELYALDKTNNDKYFYKLFEDKPPGPKKLLTQENRFFFR